MTTTAITPEQAQQAALMAELQLMREEMARERETLAAERAALDARVQQVNTGGDDSLQHALREFRSQHEHEDPNNIMNNPCQHMDGDRICGLPWRTDGEISHPKTHSYRPTPLVTTDAPKGDRYQKRKGDYEKYGVPEPVQSIADQYVSEKQAAELLGATLAQVRKLVKAGTIASDAVGDVKLIQRVSVMRIVAAKELEQGDA